MASNNKPFLTLTEKEFVTGIASAAHAQAGGLFFKADGITPIVEPGVDQSVNNSLLMPGAAPTTIGGTLTGSIIGSALVGRGADFELYLGTDDNKIWKWQLDNTFTQTLSSVHTLASNSLLGGMASFPDSSGNNYVFYMVNSSIGRYDLSTFSDTWGGSLNSDVQSPMHSFGGYLFFGNGVSQVGRINSALTITGDALTLPEDWPATAISDNGTYVVLAISNNYYGDPINPIKSCKILFWDGFNTTEWLREYPINDPYIFKLQKTPFGLFAIGMTGIWQVSLSGVKKVFSRATGIHNVKQDYAVYGPAAISYYVNALLWGGSSGSNKAIKAFGALDLSMKNALLHPFLGTAGKNITYVDGQALKGYVLVGDDTPELKAYPFSGAGTLQTGNVAQTVYIPLPQPFQLNRVRLVFGSPLASGDSIDVAVSPDETTGPTTLGTIAYDSTKTTRSKSVFKNLMLDDQLSLTLTFSAGAVKVKKIEFYGDPLEPNDA